MATPKVSNGEERPGERLSAQLSAEARQLAKLPEAAAAVVDDRRFGDLIRAVDVEARSVAELAERLIARAADPPEPARAVEQLRTLRQRIEAMATLTLEEELMQIFAPTSHERNRQIVIGYYGWEDGRRHTLTEVGSRFGITRERIRQVCARATRTPKNVEQLPAPAMDRALSLIDGRLPCSADRLEAELVRQGLTKVGMCLENVAAGAKLLKRPVAFKVLKIETGRLAAGPKQLAAAAAIVDVAKKEVYFHGLGTVGKIDRTIAKRHRGGGQQLVSEVIKLIDGFSWLDERSGWFRIGSIVKHGLPKTIEKILSVAPEVSVSKMRQAMSRNRRMWKNPPPARVLLEFCRQSPRVRVEGKRVFGDPPPDWNKALTGVERKLVRVLKEHGPVMERGAMEDLCVQDGMNRFSFHAFVSWSPVIAQFGHSVYGLLGTKVSKKKIGQLIAQRRDNRAEHRVLDSHGCTDDGKVWLSYRLSKAASTYAVITVPAALKDVVSGRFALLDIEGEQIGTLATKDGRAWGLGAFLRHQGARTDDRVTLTLDLDERTAVVALQRDAS